MARTRTLIPLIDCTKNILTVSPKYNKSSRALSNNYVQITAHQLPHYSPLFSDWRD